MKKMIWALTACTLAMGSAYADEETEEILPAEKMLLIDFVDVRDAKAEELLNIIEGRVENLAIHFPQGSSLPLRANLNGDFFELSTGDNELSLLIKKDFYVRVDRGNFLLSSDLSDWTPMENFFTGMIYAGLIKDETTPAFALLEAEINERK